MIKHVSFYDETNENLVTCKLGSDAHVGTNEKVEVAIDISMKKLDPTDTTSAKRIIYVLFIDSGGGRMGEALERELRNHNVLTPISSFLVQHAFCTVIVYHSSLLLKMSSNWEV